MGSCRGVSFVGFMLVFAIVAVLQSAALAQKTATTHVVLDNRGWIIPVSQEGAYTNWASTKTFRVGDTLTFNFATGEHDVAEVSSEAAFNACNATNSGVGPILTTGPASVALNSVGKHYYICTFGQHCSLGQKLAITVVAANAAATPSASPTTSTPPSGTADCAPVPSPARSGGGRASQGPSESGSTPSSALSSLAIGNISLFYVVLLAMGYLIF